MPVISRQPWAPPWSESSWSPQKLTGHQAHALRVDHIVLTWSEGLLHKLVRMEDIENLEKWIPDIDIVWVDDSLSMRKKNGVEFYTDPFFNGV